MRRRARGRRRRAAARRRARPRRASAPASAASSSTRRSPLSATASSSRRTGAGQRRDARAEQVLDRVGDRQLLADRRQAALGQHAPDLEREQRVAERRVDDPPQQRPRQAQPEPLGEQPRASRRGSAGRRRRARARARSSARSSARRAPGAAGEQERDAARRPAGARRTPAPPPTAASSHWTSSIATRSGAARGQRAQRVAGRRAPIACGSGGAPPARGAAAPTSSAARCGAGSASSAALDAVEQVDQRGERQLRLGAARPRDEHAHAALARERDPRLPERRLADARLALEHERAGLQARHPLQLQLAADDLTHVSCN